MLVQVIECIFVDVKEVARAAAENAVIRKLANWNGDDFPVLRFECFRQVNVFGVAPPTDALLNEKVRCFRRPSQHLTKPALRSFPGRLLKYVEGALDRVVLFVWRHVAYHLVLPESVPCDIVSRLHNLLDGVRKYFRD